MSTQPITYQPTQFLFEIQSGSVIPEGKLSYFRGRLSNRVHELVLSEFARQERENITSRAKLARRIGRKPEQITRWLGSPGNWTLDTISDLLLGMGIEPGLSLVDLKETVRPRTQGNTQLSNAYFERGIQGRTLASMVATEEATGLLRTTVPTAQTQQHVSALV